VAACAHTNVAKGLSHRHIHRGASHIYRHAFMAASSEAGSDTGRRVQHLINRCLEIIESHRT
jgi:hypothetical protein